MAEQVNKQEQIPQINVDEDQIIYPELGKRKMMQVLFYENLLLEKTQYKEESFEGYKKKYLCEEDFYAGDFVIQLKNPDHQHYTKKENKIITLEEALIIFEEIFQVDSPFSDHNKQNEYLSYAFQRAFLRLLSPEDPLDQDTFDHPEVGKKKKKKKLPKNRKKKGPGGKKKTKYINDQGYEEDVNLQISKRIYGGGYLVEKNDEWKRSLYGVRDFATLIRNLLILKLTKQGGFKIRSFISNDGQHIYLVLYASYVNLDIQAEYDQLYKELQIAQTDIFTLEPLDRKMRPLRINYQLWPKDDEYDVMGVEEKKRKRIPKHFLKQNMLRIFQVPSSLKIEIQYLLHDINYEKLCRETRVMPLNPKEEILETELQPLIIWKAYRYYLQIFKKKITELREKYKKFQEGEGKLLNKNEILDTWLESQKVKEYLSDHQKPKKVSKPVKLDEFEVSHCKLQHKIQIKKIQEIAKVFIESITEAKNKYGSNSLKTLFDYYNKPIKGFFSPFFYVRKNRLNKMEIQLSGMFKQFPINEDGKADTFNYGQRIKLCLSLIQNIANISSLQFKYKYIKNSFSISNNFLLYGNSLYDLFKQFMIKKIPTHTNLTIRKDIEEIKYKQLKPNDENNFREKISEANLNKMKKNSLDYNWPLMPWNAPLKELRNYYGEKIALYFDFMSYYVGMLIPISIIGVPAFFINVLFNYDSLEYEIYMAVFTICVVMWSSIFAGAWIRKEINFSIQFGQLDISNDEKTRPGFKGYHKKSLITNKLNELDFDEQITKRRSIFTWLVILIWSGINFGIMFGIIKLMVKLETDTDLPKLSYLALPVFIPTLIANVFYLFSEELFKFLAIKFTDFENYKKRSDYEEAFITKCFFFMTVNRLGIPFLIAFVIQRLPNFKCYEDNCLNHLDAFVRTYTYIIFVKGAYDIIMPFLKVFYSNIQKFMEQIISSNKMYEQNQYYNINVFIEKEGSKEDFTITPDIDKTTYDYLELIIQFTFLTTFGIAFPLSYSASLVLIILKFRFTKVLMMQCYQQPFPQNANTIGIFLSFINLSSYACIIVYTGIFCFTTNIVKNLEGISQITLYLIMVLCFFTIKYIIDSNFSEPDEQTKDFIKRQTFIQSKLSTRSSNQRSNKQKEKQRIPIYKPFGTILESEFI